MSFGKGSPPAMRKQDFDCPEQTVIVLNWDDVIFPRTFINMEKDSYFPQPFSEQSNFKDRLAQVSSGLNECDVHGEKLLQVALSLGHVVLVTLCERPWVELS